MKAVKDNINGKIAPTKKPLRKPASVPDKSLKNPKIFPPLSTKPETKPVRAGPALAPISPAIANKANIKVPPVFIRAAPRLYVPGQRIAEASPAIKQPIKESREEGASAVKR